MVKLRLKRIGRRKSPFYRLVAIDSRKRRDGREIERLGWYNPIKPGLQADLNEERIRYWLGEGAVPSATVHNLLTKKGINFRINLTIQFMKRKMKEYDELKSEIDRKI